MLNFLKLQNNWRWLLLIAFSLLFIAIYNSPLWDNFISYIVLTQLEFHKILNTQVMEISKQPNTYGLGLIGISFVYGVFHALGPGHGKAIIVSYLASNPQSKLHSSLLALVAALLQALTAILLVTGLSLILNYKFAHLELTANKLSVIGYSLLLVLGVYIALKSLLKLYKSNEKSTGCGSCCSSSHVKVKEKSLSELFFVALSIGLRPCSGALIILVTSSLLGIYIYGILGTLAMSLGTALCTGCIALASQYARGFLNKTLALYSVHTQQRYSLCLQLFGSVVLILLAWALLNTNTMLSNPIL